MRRLRILTWPVHGSSFTALSRLDHDWLLPVKPGAPEGYGGRGGWDFPATVRDVPAERIRETELDLVLFQFAPQPGG